MGFGIVWFGLVWFGRYCASWQCCLGSSCTCAGGNEPALRQSVRLSGLQEEVQAYHHGGHAGLFWVKDGPLIVGSQRGLKPY